MRYITIYECYDKLNIGKNSSEMSIPYEEAEELERYIINEKLDSNNILWSRDSITFINYVGFIKLSTVSIEILPKIYINSSDYDGSRKALLNMLNKSGIVKFNYSSLSMLNIYDIAILICEHYLNTIGQITEFVLSEALRYEHIHNRIPIVMLCKSCHQLYHHKYLYVPPDMIFGKWWELFEAYKMGMTRDIAFKVMMYLNKCISEERLTKQTERNQKLLQLREDILDWSSTGCHVK